MCFYMCFIVFNAFRVRIGTKGLKDLYQPPLRSLGYSSFKFLKSNPDEGAEAVTLDRPRMPET